MKIDRINYEISRRGKKKYDSEIKYDILEEKKYSAFRLLNGKQ